MKLLKFHPDKSATFFISRHYVPHAGAVEARMLERVVLPVAQPSLVEGHGEWTLGRVVEAQIVMCSTIFSVVMC